ncbi:MAG: pyruvate, phosphate dikinase [Acidimicrobiia bacterium]|nr:pyruvate, phosphate dikinase [Acidimicrobiia bacterium]
MSQRWVYGFHELDEATEAVGGEWDDVRGLLGGKGANLGDMTRLGVAVPPGFTITSEACNAYLEAGEKFPDGLNDQVSSELRQIEEMTGKTFGDPTNPLLVSCRSGAKFSMPGMMDTVLNIGMNDEVVKGMIEVFDDTHFVLDSYRRLIQMFATVVMGVREEPFEDALADARQKRGVVSDSDLTSEDLELIVQRFKGLVERFAGREFPSDPTEQLTMAVEAVFRSWNGKRAFAYRNAAGIAHDLGTAVNVQTMVFGNMGADSATGVCVSRSATTGEPRLEGDFLMNAQGEDVVAGTRQTSTIDDLAREMPALHAELKNYADALERRYRDMQDIEFTIEHGKLWLLQTRDGKRTAQAAVRIAVDLVSDGIINKTEALTRVTPEQIEFFLHPQFDAAAKNEAKSDGRLLTTGLNVSPGAAVGIVALDADLAEKWAEERQEPVILVRPETKPDDVHGMLPAAGVLTSSGGRTSHAALVARQFGKPAVVGAAEIMIDMSAKEFVVNGETVHQGEWISIDGTTGEVFSGQIATKVPDIEDPWLMGLLAWADEARELDVWANADYPDDAKRAVTLGANGIGLCRTEHMFFDPARLPVVQDMIMATDRVSRRDALDKLLPLQRGDFADLFRAMDGKPVVIRLLDPPLHEFLPDHGELTTKVTDLKIRLTSAKDLEMVDDLLREIEEAERLLQRVEALHEANPMLGLRGVRLAIVFPELPAMQIRAIFQAVAEVQAEGVEAKPEIMIPLTGNIAELQPMKDLADELAAEYVEHHGVPVEYKFGTMIETPRAALTATELAEIAEFFSFGTNDLTQMTLGISRDDAEKNFLLEYLQRGVLETNPFDTLDAGGVGKLVDMAVSDAKAVRPDIKVGICGEHGGDPASIALVSRMGLNYVSCSPLRVPVARLAAAQAALASQEEAAAE